MLSGAAVMHMDPPRIEVGGSTALATTLAKPPVPQKNRLTMTAETEFGIPAANQADPAEVGNSCLGGTTRAEEGALGGHGEIIPGKKHYR